VHVHTLRVESRAVQRRPHQIAGDLVIDGTRLLEQVERATGRAFDMASPLGWMPRAYLREYVARLTADGPAMLPSGRCELLVCAECGDLGCGCVSCQVTRDGDYIVWSELGWEADYDPTGLVRFPMGSFRFRAGELASALEVQRQPDADA
jgi:hypothetical protein